MLFTSLLALFYGLLPYPGFEPRTSRFEGKNVTSASQRQTYAVPNTLDGSSREDSVSECGLWNGVERPPWYVSVYRAGEWQCGGTLITPTKLISHVFYCGVNVSATESNTYLVSTNPSKPINASKVISIHVHPSILATGSRDVTNLAIFVLESRLPTTTVCLQLEDVEQHNHMLTVGRILQGYSWDGNKSVEVTGDLECREELGKKMKKKVIHEGSFCVTTDGCRSNGVVWEGEDGRWYLAGVLHWCYWASTLNIHNDPLAYASWITPLIGEE